MRYLVIILLLCSCTSTKSFFLDGSRSQGNIVKWQWKINGQRLDSSFSTMVSIKKITTIELVVTDDKGRKDSTTVKIK